MYYAIKSSGYSLASESWGIVFGGESGTSGAPVRLNEAKVESFGSEAFLSESFVFDPVTGKISSIRREEDGKKIAAQEAIPLG